MKVREGEAPAGEAGSQDEGIPTVKPARGGSYSRDSSVNMDRVRFRRKVDTRDDSSRGKGHSQHELGTH